MLLCSLTAMAQRGKADIKIKVDGIAATGAAKLIGWYGENQYLADTTLLAADGYYHFTRDTGYLEGFYYLLLPDKSSFQMLIDTDQSFTITTGGGQNNYAQNMKVDGALDNELLYEGFRQQAAMEPRFAALSEELKKYQRGTPDYERVRVQQDKLLDERDAPIKELQTKYPTALYTKFKIAGQNPRLTTPLKPNGDLDTAVQVFRFRDEFWNGVDFNYGRLMHTPVYFNKLKKYILDLTPQQPDSIIKYADIIVDKSLANRDLFKFTLNWIALKYKPGNSTLMDCDAVYSHLILKYWTTELAWWSNPDEIKSLRQSAKQMQGSLLGKVGQEVVARDITGKYRSTKEVTEPYMIVYIYSPNCSHCQEQTPELVKFAKKYAGTVGVFSIVTNTTDEEWDAYRKKVGITWPDVNDPSGDESKWPLKYHVDNTPEVYVLNKERVFIAKNLNVEQLEEVINRELQKGK